MQRTIQGMVCYIQRTLSPTRPFNIRRKLLTSYTVVGLSRRNTAENRRPGGPRAPPEDEIHGLMTQEPVLNGDTYGLDRQKTVTNGTNGRLFTEDELASAMTQSTLKPSLGERG